MTQKIFNLFKKLSYLIMTIKIFNYFCTLILILTTKNLKKMRTLNLLIISLILSVNGIAQTGEWKKEDRNALYAECMSLLESHGSLTNEQKESISLCYLEEITKKYTKKDLDAKIDIEIKRIQDAVIVTCAKNIGVNLNEAPKSSGSKELTLSKEAIIGQWYADGFGKLTFKEDNTYDRQNGCSSTFIVTAKSITMSKEIGNGW